MSSRKVADSYVGHTDTAGRLFCHLKMQIVVYIECVMHGLAIMVMFSSSTLRADDSFLSILDKGMIAIDISSLNAKIVESRALHHVLSPGWVVAHSRIVICHEAQSH